MLYNILKESLNIKVVDSPIDTIGQIGILPLEKQSASINLAAKIKILSGGQTGVDRAALDIAIELGIPHGGWCPKGRLSEDGTIPSHYQLVEMNSEHYADRTRQNIIDSDGTLILYHDRLQGGTLLSNRFAEQQNKPCHKVRLARTAIRPDSRTLVTKVKAVQNWLHENKIQTLNIAGPRGSKEPQIYSKAMEFLRLLFLEQPRLPFD